MIVELIVIILIVALLVVRYYEKNENTFCKSKARLDGKTALVTGGTTGIGFEIATDFAKRGAKVLIACPFDDEGKAAREEIIKRSNNDNVVFTHLDLGSLKSTRQFAEYVLNNEDKLDILVNNAGGIFNHLTEDNLNATIHVNYLGHFLLTMLLLPLLKKSGDARIVNMASIMHWFGYCDPKNFDRIDHWHKVQSYCNSKLCMILFTTALSKRLDGSGVIVNCLHPGAVGTNIYSSVFHKLAIVLIWVINLVSKTPWEGAQTAIYLAVDPEVKTSGGYYMNCRRTFVSWSASNRKVASKLWEYSKSYVQLKDEGL